MNTRAENDADNTRNQLERADHDRGHSQCSGCDPLTVRRYHRNDFDPPLDILATAYAQICEVRLGNGFQSKPQRSEPEYCRRLELEPSANGYYDHPEHRRACKNRLDGVYRNHKLGRARIVGRPQFGHQRVVEPELDQLGDDSPCGQRVHDFAVHFRIQPGQVEKEHR
jgi:hypothetical protein